MAKSPKSAPKQAESPSDLSFTGAVEQAKASVERGAAMLDACIAKVSSMLEGEEYDDRLASHLAWCLDKQSRALATLRSFGEKVKTQSLELTEEQRMRAIAKYIATSIPVTKREYFRSLLDADIPDIELVS